MISTRGLDILFFLFWNHSSRAGIQLGQREEIIGMAVLFLPRRLEIGIGHRVLFGVFEFELRAAMNCAQTGTLNASAVEDVKRVERCSSCPAFAARRKILLRIHL